VAFRGGRAGQCSNLGPRYAVDAGGLAGAWLVMQGCGESFAEVAALDVEDGRHADRERRGRLVRRLTAMQQQ